MQGGLVQGVESVGQTHKDKMVRKQHFISSLRIYYKLSDFKSVKERQTLSANSEGTSGTMTGELRPTGPIPEPCEAPRVQAVTQATRSRRLGTAGPAHRPGGAAARTPCRRAGRPWGAPAGRAGLGPGAPCF